jgi:hypothetical protein
MTLLSLEKWKTQHQEKQERKREVAKHHFDECVKVDAVFFGPEPPPNTTTSHDPTSPHLPPMDPVSYPQSEWPRLNAEAEREARAAYSRNPSAYWDDLKDYMDTDDSTLDTYGDNTLGSGDI